MNFAFRLTMPGNNAWNGKWSGDGKLYASVRNITRKPQLERLTRLNGLELSYNFGDGWRASVLVRSVTNQQARDIRKKSQGFCGYEWMIESIIQDGSIYGPIQPKPNEPDL